MFNNVNTNGSIQLFALFIPPPNILSNTIRQNKILTNILHKSHMRIILYICTRNTNQGIMRNFFIISLLTVIMFLTPVFGQTIVPANMYIVATDTAVVDLMTGRSYNIVESQHRITNYNSSIYLGDSTVALIYDSLRADRTATIVTIYETDEDSVVGLWQIGTNANRALWLNSQRASYENFPLKYRNTTEHGVVIHSMQYKYPATDSTYNGHDTIYIGREGLNYGEKNFCALLYFPYQLKHQHLQQIESSLAIRYGALLHGPYINSNNDTLWNTIGIDSLYSFGVCGIGRDDSMSLLQPRSIIRKDIITIETTGQLSDLEYVMLGCDSNSLELRDEIIIDDTIHYVALSRHWKLRAHGNFSSESINLTANIPLPSEAVHMMLASSRGTYIISPSENLKFDSIIITPNEDYYITLLIDTAALSSDAKGGKGEHSNSVADILLSNSDEHHTLNLQLSPNPSTGSYSVYIELSDDDIVNVQVVDALGRTVDQYTTPKSLSQHIYNGHLNTEGTYYITVSCNGQQKTVKLIVVR